MSRERYSFEDRKVWQRSMDLVDAAYELTESWPRREMFGLTNQLRRASVSVASNIAEGQGRKSRKDFLRFLDIAYGSLMEARTQLMIGSRREFSSIEQTNPVLSMTDEIGRMLNGLKRSLRTAETDNQQPTTDNSAL
jgi:four helix bundle protein